MAITRETLKRLCGHLHTQQKDLLPLALFARSLSSHSAAHSSAREISGNIPSNVEPQGFRLPKLGGTRNISAVGHDSQNFQLEDNSATSVSTPGFPTAAPFGSGGSKVPGFSVVPPSLKPFLTGPVAVTKLDSTMLAREMSVSLSHGRLDETVRLFEDWAHLKDTAGYPNKPNTLAYNLLLHAKLRLGAQPDTMYRLIDDMKNAGVIPTQLSYNFVLRAIFRQRDSKMAERILEKMEQAGPEGQPDGDSYNFVIALCALDRRIGAALKHMQGMYERGFVPSKTTYNELLIGCARVHRTRVAVAIMKELKIQELMTPVQTMGEVVTAAVEVDDSECALLALQLMHQANSGIRSQTSGLDEGGLVAVLGTAARTGNGTLANVAWDLLTRSLISAKAPGPAAYLARVHACATSGDFDTAFSILHEMQGLYGNAQTTEDSEILSPFSSLRPLVLAISRAGPAALDAAYYKLAEMHGSGHPVCLPAINCVLLGCANIWDADRAYQTFEAIGSTFGLRPDVHSINALLDAFGKNRKIHEVVKLFEYMKENSVSPNHRSHELFITAHVINRDIQSALSAVTVMMNAGHVPTRDTLFKVWRRCRREADADSAWKVHSVMKNFGYRESYLGEGRRRLITSGTRTQQQMGASNA